MKHRPLPELEVIILAAGLGTRMRSSRPKVLHKLAGKSLIKHVVDTVSKLRPGRLHLVISKEGDEIRTELREYDNINFVVQAERLGTGHAVQQALAHCQENAKLIFLYGDVPLISEETLRKISNSRGLTLLSIVLENPEGYGRVIRNAEGVIQGIVEDGDANTSEKAIKEINSGIMSADKVVLEKLLSAIDNKNSQREYLLTDIVSRAAREGIDVEAILTNDLVEVQGVNSQAQLNQLERAFQARLAQGFLEQGVKLMDPSRFDCRGELEIGADVEIDVNCVFEGVVRLADGVRIGANCHIGDCQIGAGTFVKPNSVLDGAIVGRDCQVGPFARLRPGTVLHDEVSIGNFVETKAANIGSGTKASHLSYLGDTEIGKGVNVGAGTITCNYDGVHKHLTKIEDNVFIGSNTALVAPVTISRDATIGAGSVITEMIPEGNLAIGRGRQRNIIGWRRPEDKSKHADAKEED